MKSPEGRLTLLYPSPQIGGLGRCSHRRGSVKKYFLSMSMAKELAMVENNKRGRKVRKSLRDRDKE